MSMYKDLFDLSGQVAVVTGGAGMLGSECCRALCEFGATVICLDVQKNNLDKLVHELQHQYGNERISSCCCDVSNPEEVESSIHEIATRFTKIDILLNNAVARPKETTVASFTEYPLEAWRNIMAINLDGMFLMAQAVGKHMLARKYGVILQTASIYSLLAPDHRIYTDSEYHGKRIETPAVYTASKAGVIGLTKHLATLWAGDGIRVNAICPGGIASGQNDAFQQKYSARIPLGRMAHRSEIVGPMLFLVSKAATYVTGHVFYADGGLSAW